MFIFKYTCHVLKCLESAELMHLRVWYAEALICVKKHAFVCYYDILSTEMLRVHYLPTRWEQQKNTFAYVFC